MLPVCAWVDGEYGISGVYLGVEAEIGAGGVRKVVERDLTDTEKAALKRGRGRRPGQAGRRRRPVVPLPPGEARPLSGRASPHPGTTRPDAYHSTW